MGTRLWHMNADFEIELAHPIGTYRRLPKYAALNQCLAPCLLWLAHAGDALLLREPWSTQLQHEAHQRGVELVSPDHATQLPAHSFTPWGWTPSAVAAGARVGAVVSQPVAFDIVARVNSKLWSHAL